MFSVGAAAIGLAFFVLKFTFLFHDIEQIRRMRSGLNADDASFQVRLKNQETFNAYLLKRPLGAGIGSSGFWGSRFLPDEHPIKDIPTDSYYVRIWVETGIIGLCLHLLMFGFFCGIGAAMVWQIRDRILRAQAGALLAAFAGNVVASYGNQVYSQMPTAVVLGIGLPLVYLAARFDD